MAVKRRSPSAAARLAGNDGFTLVEALASFAILALLTVFVQRGVVAAKSGLLRAGDRVAAERVAESLLAEPLGEHGSTGQSRTGVTDRYRWIVRTEPLDLPAAEVPRAGAAAPRGAVGKVERFAPENASAPGGAPVPGAGKEAQGKRARWQPMRVTIQVGTPSGRMVDVETVRLVKVR